MNIAVMQPYFFPYIGYFQLISCSDKFIFYDDVNFIKNGWINRNRILINGNPCYITVKLNGASSFKSINQIKIIDTRKKIIKSIEQAYRTAPYFTRVFPILEDIMNTDTDFISKLAIESVIKISDYLGLQTIFEISSEYYSQSKGMGKQDRLISICRDNHATNYINFIGGKELYDKEYFKENKIDLFFLESNLISYTQKHGDFIANLSIIDVLMFNSISETHSLLNEYRLI